MKILHSCGVFRYRLFIEIYFRLILGCRDDFLFGNVLKEVEKRYFAHTFLALTQ